jgi:hypothetical protein
MSNGHSEEGIAATAGPDYNDGQDYHAQELQDQEQQKREQRMTDLNNDITPMTRSQFLNGLVKRHNLVVNEDIWKDEHLGFSIIKLTGIEKIQTNLNIRVTFEDIVIEREFAVIKATATGQYNSVQSYGSVVRGKKPDGNHVGTYIVEMAEKRAKNRAVLKLCGAYKYGLYSEDESDDFKKKA